jgi:hypothetical protein
VNQGEIRVAEYLTALPEEKLLAAKLHDASRTKVRQRRGPASPKASWSFPRAGRQEPSTAWSDPLPG